MTSSYVRKIIPRFLEMFEARGYENNHIVDVNTSPLVIQGYDPVDNEDVRLLYFDNPKFNVRTAETCVNHAEKVKHLVIVYKNDITCFARRVLDTYKGASFEHMPAKELEINITKHVLQPKKFVKLSPSQRDAFKEKWGENFPKMLEKDKIARYFNFKKGEVIEIHRRNGDVVYRIVVDSDE